MTVTATAPNISRGQVPPPLQLPAGARVHITQKNATNVRYIIKRLQLPLVALQTSEVFDNSGVAGGYMRVDASETVKNAKYV